MSDQSVSPQPSPLPRPLTSRKLHILRAHIISNLTQSLHHTSEKLAQSAAGHSVFSCNEERKAALDLLKLLPHLLAQLPAPPKRRKIELSRGGPLIAQCPICLKGPGAHWVMHCPDADSRREELNHLYNLQCEGKLK